MRKAVTLAVICARQGSKGLPRKNVRPLCGKPLIAWSIEAANAARLVDQAIVSTDSEEIRRVARRWGGTAPFLRPPELATDTASSYDVLRHAVRWWEEAKGPVSAVVLLQPTSPLRTARDIDEAIGLLRGEEADAVVSVTPANPPPYWMVRLTARGAPQPVIEYRNQFITPRQKLPPAYVVNGAVYVLRRDYLMERKVPFVHGRTRCLVMSPERSIDIDFEEDFLVAEALMRRRCGAGRRVRR